MLMKNWDRNLAASAVRPEQIVGEARKDGVDCVSHECIYQHVWEDKRKKGELYKNLRTEGKRYRKRGSGKDKRVGPPMRNYKR